jgi:hypothetical protein
MTGAPHRLSSPHIQVNNRFIHEEVVALFSQIFQGDYRHSMPNIPAR